MHKSPLLAAKALAAKASDQPRVRRLYNAVFVVAMAGIMVSVLLAQGRKEDSKAAETSGKGPKTYHTVSAEDLARNFGDYVGRRVAIRDQFRAMERRIITFEEINDKDYLAFSTYSDLTICVKKTDKALVQTASTLARSENITVRGKVIGGRRPYKYVIAETIVRGHVDNLLTPGLGKPPKIEVYLNFDAGGRKKLLGSGKYQIRSKKDNDVHTLELEILVDGKTWTVEEQD